MIDGPRKNTMWIIRGIASVLFGVLALLKPGASIAAASVVGGAVFRQATDDLVITQIRADMQALDEEPGAWPHAP